MIINLEWEPSPEMLSNTTFNLNFDLPNIVFFNYHNVSVKQILLTFYKSEPALYGFIESTLIDQSVINPYQQLLTFCKTTTSNFLLFTPIQANKFPVQRQQLVGSEFKLILSKKTKIKKIYLQLEICNDNRF